MQVNLIDSEVLVSFLPTHLSPWDEHLVKITGKESVTSLLEKRVTKNKEGKDKAVTIALGTLSDNLKDRIDELDDSCSSLSPQSCCFEFFQLVTRS